MQTQGNKTYFSLRYAPSRFSSITESLHQTVLKSEREETEEAEFAVAALRRRVESGREVLTSLDANIQTLRARVANLRKGRFLPSRFPLTTTLRGLLTERERERDTLAMHDKPVSAELRTCERAFALDIEGVGPDQLLFRYSLKSGDNSRSTREASFVLDLSSQSSYKGTLYGLRPFHTRTEEIRQY
jgi:kinetochore protein Spc25, fungi type